MRKIVLLGVVLAMVLWAQVGDRSAAEWALRYGGKVRVAGSAVWTSDAAALPAGEFRLEGVDLVGTIVEHRDLKKLSACGELKELWLPGTIFNPGAGSTLDANAELAALQGLTKLERLGWSLHFLEHINVQDKGMLEFGNLTQIRELRMAMTKVKGPGLAPFVNVERLDLNNTLLNDEGMRQVAKMQKLRYLSLRDSFVGDAGLLEISGLKELEVLDLAGLRVTDAGVAALRGMKKLRQLNLQGAGVTDVGAEVLATLPALEQVNLYRTKISNVGLRRLGKLAKLRAVDARYTRVTRAGVEELGARVRVEFQEGAAGMSGAGLRAARPLGQTPGAVADWVKKMGGKVEMEGGVLRGVDLSRTPLTEGQLGFLTGLNGLERLRLESTEIGDGGMASLAKLGSLVELDLGHTLVSDAGVAQLGGLSRLRKLVLNHTLSQGRLPRLEVLEELEVANTEFDDASAKQVAELPRLRVLRAAYTDITAGGVAALEKTGLRVLELRANDIGDEAFAPLGRMRDLEELDVSYGRQTSGAIAKLAGLEKLRVLASVRTRLDDKAAPELAKLKGLRVLRLNYTGLGDEGLAALVLPELEELEMDTANLTDASVEVLARLPRLRRVNLYHTLITEAGFQRLKKLRPQLEIVFDRESSIPVRRKS